MLLNGGNGRVDRGVPEPYAERVVRVLLERRIRQDPALCGRLDSKGRDIDVEVAADDPVVNVVGVDIE